MNEWVMMLVIFIPVLIITACTPYVVRRTESFGVSIPSEVFDHAELKSLRKQFASIIILIGLICFGLTTVFVSDQEWLIAGSIFVYLALFFIVYLCFHFRMKKLKAENDWYETKQQSVAIDLQFQQKRPIVSNVWFSIGILIWLGTVICTFVFYDRIPDIIPLQYDFQGNVTNTTEKSWLSVFALPIIQLSLLILFIFLNAVIAKTKQQLDPSNPNRSAAQNLKFRRRWSMFLLWMGNAIVALFAFIQLSLIFALDPLWIGTVAIVFTGVTLVGAIILAFTTGQGGSRIPIPDEEATNKINRDDDRYWKLGMFYYNPDDPALWLEKRFGVGWTMNMGRPSAWLIFLGIFLLILLPLLLI